MIFDHIDVYVYVDGSFRVCGIARRNGEKDAREMILSWMCDEME